MIQAAANQQNQSLFVVAQATGMTVAPKVAVNSHTNSNIHRQFAAAGRPFGHNVAR